MGLLSTIGAASGRAFGFTRSAIAQAVDAYFNRVTLLLPGNGTNGAQNNTFLDSSSNNFSITRNGNTTQGTFTPFSQTGWSINNTTNEHGIKTSSSVTIGTSVFTIEFWIYFTNTPSAGYIGFAQDGTANSLQSYGDLTTLGFGRAGVGNDVSGNPGFTLNTWYHVAVARDSSNRMSLWVNGSRIGTATGVTSNYAAAPVAMGGTAFRYQGYCSNGRLVIGTAVYDPTATTITVPTSPLTAITNTSVLLGTSNRFNDASANNYGITVTGTPSVQAFSPFTPSAAYSAATNGGSGYFDGSGDYLLTASSSNLGLGTGNFTIELWYYANASQGSRTILIGNNSGFTTNAWNLQINNASPAIANRLQLWAYNLNSGAVAMQGSTALVPNTWYHVALVRNANSFTLYLNGVSNATLTSSASLDGGGANTISVARDQTDYFGGYISGVRILKGTAQYTTGFTPPTAPPADITNTQLLLNFTNGGITDATGKNVLETVGNAQISTTQSKWGGSSMYFDGTDDRLFQAASNQNVVLGTGDFTVEGWAYHTSRSVNRGVFQITTSSTGLGSVNSGLSLLIQTDGRLNIYAAGATSGASTTTTTVALNTWFHFAIVRASSVTKLYLNGSLVTDIFTSGSLTDTFNYTASYLTVGGSFATTNLWAGYIQDLRITKGYARYTGNFTPPTQAFPLQ